MNMSESEIVARIENFKEHGTQDFNPKIVDVLIEAMGGADDFSSKYRAVVKNGGYDDIDDMLIDSDKIEALYAENREEILEVAGYVNEAFPSVGEWLQFTDPLTKLNLDEIYSSLYDQDAKQHGVTVNTLILELCHH
jgi:hypothetical protein